MIAKSIKKSYNMAKTMNIPILGMIENMSYIKCPHSGKDIKVFGNSSMAKATEELGIKYYGRMPIYPEFTQLCDEGRIEEFDKMYLDEFVEKINDAVNI